MKGLYVTRHSPRKILKGVSMGLALHLFESMRVRGTEVLCVPHIVRTVAPFALHRSHSGHDPLPPYTGLSYG